MAKNGKSESYIKQAMKPSGGKFIQALTDGGIIAEHEHGWIVCDDVNASALRIASK
jgi:hypothetical protein